MKCKMSLIHEYQMTKFNTLYIGMGNVSERTYELANHLTNVMEKVKKLHQ